jgi:putative copper export protein
VDTGDWTLLSLWVHIPIVTAWIGLVMLDVYVASVPGLSTEQRGRMITWSRTATIVLIVVILVTGIWQTVNNPFNGGVSEIQGRINSYSELKALRENTNYGMALFLKHIFVVATFALTLAVRFYFAPRLSRTPPVTATASGAAVAVESRELATVRWLSILNLLACLGALIFATRMVWELH